jgi:hypothetical protein
MGDTHSIPEAMQPRIVEFFNKFFEDIEKHINRIKIYREEIAKAHIKKSAFLNRVETIRAFMKTGESIEAVRDALHEHIPDSHIYITATEMNLREYLDDFFRIFFNYESGDRKNIDDILYDTLISYIKVNCNKDSPIYRTFIEHMERTELEKSESKTLSYHNILYVRAQNFLTECICVKH